MEKDILSPRQILVKAGRYFNQRGEASMDVHVTLGGLHDPAENFQSRALASAVVPDDAKGLPTLYFEREILQGPEFPLVRFAEFLLLEHFSGQGRQQVAQGVEDFPLAELLIDMLHPERDIRHQTLPSNAFRKGWLEVLEQEVPTKQHHHTENKAVRKPRQFRWLMADDTSAEPV